MRRRPAGSSDECQTTTHGAKQINELMWTSLPEATPISRWSIMHSYHKCDSHLHNGCGQASRVQEQQGIRATATAHIILVPLKWDVWGKHLQTPKIACAMMLCSLVWHGCVSSRQ